MYANERRARARTEAAEWWVEIQSGEPSRARREEFVDWLRESSVHVAEMLHIARLHGALEQFEHWDRISIEEAEARSGILEFPVRAPESLLRATAMDSAAEPAEPRRIFRRRWVRLVGSIAASLFAVGVGAWLVWNLNGQTIETARGERRQVALADGSVLQVDPETRLKVVLKQNSRRIELQRGRALFRVAKDSRRPFLVQAEGTTVRAVGTTFAVDRQRLGITVTVAEGKVAVSALPAVAARRTEPTFAAMLTADEQVTVGSSGLAEPVRKIDSSQELAWTWGRLVFNDATVAQALIDFNRYNRVQLYVASEGLATRRVSGMFDASDPESFIAFVQALARVDVVRDPSGNVTIIAAP